VVDTIGELESFYALADVVFVGGSLVRHGGQNMIEPAALGKPTLFGPHIDNFRSDVELLLAAEAAAMVRSVDELCERVCALLEDREIGRAMGRRAMALIAANTGATERTLEHIEAMVRSTQAGRGAAVGPGAVASSSP
jgi:3-deoxy-D-manno-octulosonic-acid transferase